MIEFIFMVVYLLWQLVAWAFWPVVIVVALGYFCVWVDAVAKQREDRLREIVREELRRD